jgi:hypothetical protein
MLLAGRDGPDAVSQHRRVLEHARRAGVSHVVKLSENGASAASPISLMRAAGLPAWRAFDLAHVAAAYAAVDHDVSPDLESLLGRRPRALAEFLADHGDAFRPAHS